jgi:hypothetical protein
MEIEKNKSAGLTGKIPIAKLKKSLSQMKMKAGLISKGLKDLSREFEEKER